MIPGWAARTVAAVCRQLCAELAGATPADPTRTAFTCAWAGGQIGRMPRHYRLALLAATGWLGCATLPGGAFFAAAPAGRQQAVLARWRRSRLGPKREVVRFFESLCAVAYFAPEAAPP